MASYTGQTLVNLALTDLGILEQGGVPNISDSLSMLAILNNMIQVWHLKGVFVWSVGFADFPLSANVPSYTIGPTGTFNTVRPSVIDRAQITIPNPSGGNIVTFPLRMLTNREWVEISDSSAVGDIPQRMYYDRASPLGTLYFDPIPRAAVATKVRLYTWAQLGTFAALATSVDFPDGYPEAIVSALAYRGLAMFGVAVSQQVAEVIRQRGLYAEQAIAELNVRMLGIDPPQTPNGTSMTPPPPTPE